MEVLNIVLFYVCNKQNVYDCEPGRKCLKVEILPENCVCGTMERVC